MSKTEEKEGKGERQMIGIIVAGHGNFPTGIMSAVSLIAGNPEHIKAVDFVKECPHRN